MQETTDKVWNPVWKRIKQYSSQEIGKKKPVTPDKALQKTMSKPCISPFEATMGKRYVPEWDKDSLPSTPEIHPSSIEWVTILDGAINNLDAAKIKAIEENLRDLAQDRNLIIKKIENRSIVVRVESTKEGFQKVSQL